ncbi:hypothetical protein EDB89DRAFT_1273324 [Lactarius sanguifluus]|nr:hypothetical protein EDB89DRAFT_1273324 [Lactarius sanguifluus]
MLQSFSLFPLSDSTQPPMPPWLHVSAHGRITRLVSLNSIPRNIPSLSEFEDVHLWRDDPPSLHSIILFRDSPLLPSPLPPLSRLPSHPPSERTTPTCWKAFFARRTRGVPRLLSRAAISYSYLKSDTIFGGLLFPPPTNPPSLSSSTFPITPTPSSAFGTLCRHNVSKPYRGSRRGSQCNT